MTAPEPRAFFLVVLDQGERLRVVHNDEVVIEKVADAILVNHLFENFLFDAGEIDPGALERVVDFLCDREKIGGALDNLHSVRNPRLFISKVSEEIISATPPP